MAGGTLCSCLGGMGGLAGRARCVVEGGVQDTKMGCVREVLGSPACGGSGCKAIYVGPAALLGRSHCPTAPKTSGDMHRQF